MVDEDKHWAELIGGIKPLPNSKPIAPTHVNEESRITRKIRPKVHVADRLPDRETPTHNKSPGLICGSHDGIDRVLRKKMDVGEIPVEARIDLHYLTIEQAYERACTFINSSYAIGLRLVLVITGKGKNTPTGQQTIHQMFPIWLNSGDMRNKIVRFCQATSRDGGDGAFYLLLRRKRE